MQVGYDIYVAPGEAPDKQIPSETHEVDGFVSAVSEAMKMGFENKPLDDNSARRIRIEVDVDGHKFSYGPMWFSEIGNHVLQTGITDLHRTYAGKPGIEGASTKEELRDE